jgi:hypothetical protein
LLFGNELALAIRRRHTPLHLAAMAFFASTAGVPESPVPTLSSASDSLETGLLLLFRRFFFFLFSAASSSTLLASSRSAVSIQQSLLVV